ncbi:MAG: TatD family hydrolase [Clostridiales bacterium]|nr:TatD family hydrolase [Clostridiales bacterium]MCF8023524.1 TatD family hydrolase [Clostridiales bacterium]
MSLRNMIDSHTHLHLIPYEGLEEMARQGITRAVSCAVVFMARYAESYFDQYRALQAFHRPLASSAGVEMYTAVGIHPAGIPEDWPRVIEHLGGFLSEEGVVAVGEVGMNQGSQVEKNVLRAQLEVARDYGVPAVVHTPKENKKYITDQTLEIAGQVGIPGSKLIIDHTTLDIIGQINDYGAVPGMTIRDKDLSPADLVENLDSFSNGILNSDYRNISHSNPTGMLDAVEYMMARGVDPSVVSSLARDKAAEVFGIY